jgi:hypothetical protein
VVWLRIEILPTHVAWRPAAPSSKGSNPPETHQSGSDQFEDVAGEFDVAVPEIGPASTVGTAQDIYVLPQLELAIHPIKRGIDTRKAKQQRDMTAS